MTSKLSIKDLELKGKKVLMRVDFNVPMDKHQQITDDTRIAASIPSIRYLIEHGAAIILMSHLGRPKEMHSKELSLAPCAKKLSELLGHPVIMAHDSVGPEVEKLAAELRPGQILLLENLRFHPGEENPDSHPEFVQALAKLGDVYINDAFGTAHRAHASTAALAKLFPKQAAVGLLLQKEMDFLGEALLHPKRPFFAILGGAKVSSKFGVIKSLVKKVDVLLIGGGMAYTFLKAQGYEIGDSLYEEEFIGQAKEVLRDCERLGVSLLLPEDHEIANKIAPDATIKYVTTQEGIPPGFRGVDIGLKTTKEYTEALQSAKTVLWNGPLGIFEIPAFSKGTIAVAKALSHLSSTTIVGGGDSIAALHVAGVADKMTHISTGGGASLEYIEFGTLPGINALSNGKPKVHAHHHDHHH